MSAPVPAPVSNLVTTEVDGGVMTIRMNRPAKKNALNLEMYEALAEAFARAGQDPDVRVVMITGTNGSFTAGNDIQDFLQNPPKGNDSPVMKFLNAISSCELPVVAAVNGTAVGVGVTMLLHCDLVYVADNAALSLPFVDLGLVPEAAASMLLPRLAGHQKAAELLMLGEPFTPQEAKDIGIANAVLPPADVEKTALATARKLAAKPRDALRLTKSLLRRDFESVAARMDKEAEAFKKCLASPDAKEAFTAFREKRKPKFN